MQEEPTKKSRENSGNQNPPPKRENFTSPMPPNSSSIPSPKTPSEPKESPLQRPDFPPQNIPRVSEPPKLPQTPRPEKSQEQKDFPPQKLPTSNAPPESPAPAHKPQEGPFSRASTPVSPPPSAPRPPSPSPPTPPSSIHAPKPAALPPTPQPRAYSQTAQKQEIPKRQQQKYSPDQKSTYLKRGEVTTMQKDIIRMREQGARKEQSRIAQLQDEQNIEQEKDVVQKIRATASQRKKQEQAQHRENFQKLQSSILPPGEELRVQNLPALPSRSRKVQIRSFIVLILALIIFNVVLFGVWLIFLKDGDTQPPVEPPIVEPPIVEPPVEPPIVVPPTSLFFEPDRTTAIQFSDKDDLAVRLAQFLQEPQAAGFTQIVFSNTSTGLPIAQGNEFFELLEISVPERTSSQFANDSLFFVYSFERGNRFGFVTQISDKAAATAALKEWEATIEQDLQPLNPIWETLGEWYTHSFKSQARQNVEIHFQTFSKQDKGIVYAVTDDYLIFGNSFETTEAVISRLELSSAFDVTPKTLASLENPEQTKPPDTFSLEQMVGQVLLIGFNDATLTPQLKELMERLRPGGVLLLSRNIKNEDQLKKLTQDLQNVSLGYSSLPLLIAVDQEGGTISRIDFAKEKTAQSEIETVAHAYQVGQDRSTELQYLGVNLNLSPVLDQAAPEDFIFDRTFQTKGSLATRFAQSLLAGQKSTNTLSALKHFPGYGDISFNPEKKLATVQELPDLAPFIAALSAEPEFLLVSNVIYTILDSHKPFSFLEQGISIIREDMSFDGIILSDDLSQPSLLDNYTLKEIILSPLEAGVNMIMLSKEKYAEEAYEILLEELQQNPQMRKQVEDSVARIRELKESMSIPFESNQFSQSK